MAGMGVPLKERAVADYIPHVNHRKMVVNYPELPS